MKKLLLLVVITAIAVTAGTGAQDARAVVAAAATAMGTDMLRSVEYSGTRGSTYAVGQAPGPGKPWPRFTIVKYNVAINYEAPAMREAIVRIDDENPPRGGGAGGYVPATGQGGIRPIPFGPQTLTAVRDAGNDVALLQIWLTPHGFLKTAASNSSLRVSAGAGRPSRTVSFTSGGKYVVTGTINDQNLVERVETRVPHPLLGDMLVEAVYSDYRDVAGIKFPMRSSQRQGGFPTLDVIIDEVRPNSAAAAQLTGQTRESGAAAEPTRFEAKEVSPGLWFVSAGGPMSVLVEFSDHLLVVEAQGNDERTDAVLAAIRRVRPHKPIRYLVNTHHHADHAGGLRGFVAHGVIVMTHELNKPYFERILKNPFTLSPDRLARAPRPAVVEGVKDKRVLSDAMRTIELHHVRGNLHDEALLMVYLPKEKFLIQADAFAPRPPGAKPLPSSPYTVNLLENIRRLKLDVAQLVHVHGGTDPFSALVANANRTGTQE